MRRGGERTDAACDRGHARLLIVDLGALADLGDAELLEIGAIDRDRVGRRQVVERAVDDVPGLASRRTLVGAPTMSTGVEAPPFGLRQEA